MWTILLPLALLSLPAIPGTGPGTRSADPVGAGLPIRAQDPREDSEADQRFAALEGRYRAALDAHVNEVRLLRSQGVPPERWPDRPTPEWIPLFRELAEGGSGRADLWILEHLDPRVGDAAPQRALAEECLHRLVELHADRDYTLQAFDHLGRRSRAVDAAFAVELLSMLSERSSNPEIVARAYFEQAMLISEGLTSEDPEVLERAFGLLRIAADGYAGTRGAVYAADRLFTRARIRHWHEVTAWAELVRRLTAEGTPPSEWPPFPVEAVRAEFVPLAHAGHPLAQQWLQVVHPAHEQAARRGLAHGMLEYASALSRLHHAGLEAAMDARFGLLQALVETWPDEALMFDLVQSLQDELVSFRAERYEPVLGALAERTSDDRVRHQALYTLAQTLERSNREAEIERAAALYRRIQDEAPLERQRRQAELALLDLAKLLPGAPAPDFNAEDTEGFAINLREYRGKVVLLAFWGFWDPATSEILPELNRLHERFAGRPFAVLGMNTDLRERVSFREEMREHGVAWRNSLQQTRHCAVCGVFRVHAFPMFVLVDADGILRARGLPLADAGERIEHLVRRAEADAQADEQADADEGAEGPGAR